MALPAIRDAFDTDLASVQWVIVVFIATRAGLALGAGAFADRFGLRVVYLFGTVTYLIAMLCLTLSPTLEAMVGFRALQALGTGCLYSTAPAIAAFIFPDHRRGLSMGFTSAQPGLRDGCFNPCRRPAGANLRMAGGVRWAHPPDGAGAGRRIAGRTRPPVAPGTKPAVRHSGRRAGAGSAVVPHNRVDGWDSPSVGPHPSSSRCWR